MTLRFSHLLTCCALVCLALSCGDGGQRVENMKDNAAKGTGDLAAAAEAADVPVEAVDTVMRSGGVTLRPMPATKEFPNAKITDWTYENGVFNYRVTGYEFAAPTPDADALMCANSGKGQHAHLIINNEPYLAKYEPNFAHELPDGEHYILTFLSRSYHESIKNGMAARAVKATVDKGSFAETTDIQEPMLFYSRPKGTYSGKDTENVMLDFYPVNADLSRNGYYVEASVNGGEALQLTEWQPYYLIGLPMGENTVRLTLMQEGKRVDTPLNPVTRTFTLQADPAGK